jgi:hypothetical protein
MAMTTPRRSPRVRTERQRLLRARRLLALLKEGDSKATVWRKVNPGSRSKDDSAAKMWQREVDWLEQWLQEHPDEPFPSADGKWWAPPKLCDGAGDRPCGKEIPRRRKRCKACAAEQTRLNRTVHRRNYYESHREQCNAKRNQRRSKKQIRERTEAAAAAKRAEEERRASLPQLTYGVGKKPRIYDPKTGKTEHWIPWEARFQQ